MEPIIYLDRSRVREGRFGDLKRAIDALVGFIAAREPQLLFYRFFLDEERSEMTVVAVHPDTHSLELHLQLGGPAFRPFAELLELQTIEIYGEPSTDALERLREKAKLLGTAATVIVRPGQAGFARFDSAAGQPSALEAPILPA